MTTLGVSDLLFYIIYCSQGVAIFVANGLLLATILFEQSLRKQKELLIIACMAGADIIYGLGTITIAIYRIFIISEGEQSNLVTAWHCMTLTPYPLLQIGSQLSPIMNVVLSTDRLMAVAWPNTYRKLDRRYSGRVLALIVSFGVCSLVAMFTSTYFDTSHIASIPKLCMVPSFSHSYNLYYSTVLTGSGLLSVVIYIGVFVAYRRSMSRIAPRTNDQQQRAIAQQHRLTVTLGIITISTLFLFVIPNMIPVFYAFMNIVFTQSALIGLISRFSTISNVAIYVYRQKEVQTAMRKLITCRKTTATGASNTIHTVTVK